MPYKNQYAISDQLILIQLEKMFLFFINLFGNHYYCQANRTAEFFIKRLVGMECSLLDICRHHWK